MTTSKHVSHVASVMNWLGVQKRSDLYEVTLSILGGFISLLLITQISIATTGQGGAVAVVPAMGAATLLLFTLPHSPMAQPWPLFAGNMLSAFIGVTCAMYADSIAIAAGLAVGVSVGLMHIFRCTHLPGGATALAAVIGGESVHNLGYGYVLMPVLLNCLIIFGIALVFNNLFPWRRYPTSAMRFCQESTLPHRVPLTLSHLEQAQRELDLPVALDSEQLLMLFSHSQAISEKQLSDQLGIEVGKVYCNNKPGNQWAVRKVIDLVVHKNPAHSLVIYRVLDGAQRNQCDSCSLAEFAAWAEEGI